MLECAGRSARAFLWYGQIMHYRVPETLHYCRVNDHAVFLDMLTDRYFALAPKQSATFERLLFQGDVDGDLRRASHEFTKRKLLIRCESATPFDRISVPAPTRAVVHTADEMDISIELRLRALWELIAWRLLHRFLGLSRALNFYRRLGIRQVTRPFVQTVNIKEICLAFCWAEQFVTADNHCTPRSLALAAFLRRHGCAPYLVIGVQLRPFCAHCWVQLGDQVVNDHVDMVSACTPIFVL